MRQESIRASCSLLSLAAGLAVGLPLARGAVFTFSGTCNVNWNGTCAVTNGCGVGVNLNQNNWGLTACSPGIPAQPGAGDDVVFPLNATINVLVGVNSITAQPGVSITDAAGIGTTSGVFNSGSWTTTTGNKTYTGAILNGPGGTWTESSGGWGRAWTNVAFVNQGLLNLPGVVVTSTGACSIDNQGTLATVPGTGSTITGLALLNAGTIGVGGSNLTFTNCSYAGAGAINVSASRTLIFNNLSLSGAINGSSAGTFRSAGTLSTTAPGTLNISGNGLEIAGDVNTSAGLLTSTGVVDITTGNKTFTGALTNALGATWNESSGGWARSLHGVAFTNHGTLNIPGMLWTAASGANTLLNAGSIVATPGTGSTITGMDITNTGGISVTGSNLTLSALHYSGGGTITVATSRTLTMNNVGFAGPINGSNAGTLQATGTLTTTGATTLNVDGNGFGISGNINASVGGMTNLGLATVTSGPKTLAGAFNNAPGATYTDSSGGWSRTLDNCTFSNQGTLNIPGALWSLGTAGSTLTNTGTINIPAGTGATITAIPITNDGTINVSGSNLTLASLAYSGTGALNVAASRTANLASCTYSGVLNAHADGTLSATGITTTAPTTLNVSGTGVGINGNVNSSAGLLTNASIAYLTAGHKVFTGPFTNALGAVLTDNAGGWTKTFADGVFTNAGTFVCPSSTVFSPGTPGGSIVNTGTVRKLGGGGTFTNSVATTNDGLWDVEQGTMNQGGPYTQGSPGATTRVRAGAVFTRSSTTFAGGRVEGLGTFNGSVVNNGATVAPGQPDDPTGPLTIAGAYTQGAGGTLEISIGARPPANDDRLVSTGAMNLDGTLRLKLATNFAPTVGDVYEVARSNNSQRNATFANVQVIGRFGATFLITYTASSVLAEVTGTYCAADIDDGSGTGTPDGGITIDDLLYFMPLFDAGDPAADFDDGSATGVPDLGVTIDDLIYFLQRFDAGC